MARRIANIRLAMADAEGKSEDEDENEEKLSKDAKLFFAPNRLNVGDAGPDGFGREGGA